MIRRYQVHFIFIYPLRGYSIPFTHTMFGDGSEAARVAWIAVVRGLVEDRKWLPGFRLSIHSIEPLN